MHFLALTSALLRLCTFFCSVSVLKVNWPTDIMACSNLDNADLLRDRAQRNALRIHRQHTQAMNADSSEDTHGTRLNVHNKIFNMWIFAQYTYTVVHFHLHACVSSKHSLSAACSHTPFQHSATLTPFLSNLLICCVLFMGAEVLPRCL